MTMRPLGALLGLMCALTGCVGSSDGEDECPGALSQTLSAPCAELVRFDEYAEIDELIYAVQAAGLECETWEKQERLQGATDSKFCVLSGTTSVTASLYTTQAKQKQAIRENVNFARRNHEYGYNGYSALVGPYWTVEAPVEALREIKPELGGVLRDSRLHFDF